MAIHDFLKTPTATNKPRQRIMNRTIRKVAVLGSGIMGSRIACHFANIGVDVLLLDIAPKELTEEEKKKLDEEMKNEEKKANKANDPNVEEEVEP